MKYAEAKKIADRVVGLLSPYCDVCLVAGSIRRKAPVCGDVEIVCMPTLCKDLFGEDAGRPDVWGRTIYSYFKVDVGAPDGRYIRAKMGATQIDIFMPRPCDFWRQFVTRTGSGEFSRRVAAKWVSLGWRGTPDGLRRESQCTQTGNLWAIKPHEIPILPPAWKSEVEFFEWLGLPWVEPELR